jgi:polysaccharide biosynthesis transport protein
MDGSSSGYRMSASAHPWTHPSRASWAVLAARFLAGFLFVVVAVAAAWPHLPRHYEAHATIILRPSEGDGPAAAGSSMRAPLDEAAIESELDMIRSSAVLDDVIEAHRLASDPEFDGTGGVLPRLKTWLEIYFPPVASLIGDPVVFEQPELRESLSRRVSVVRKRRSYTVEVGVRSSDPEKSAALTAALLSAYSGHQLARKRGSAKALYDWLDERARILRDRYNDAQSAVSAYMRRTELFDRGAQMSLEARLAALSTEQAAVQARKLETGTRADTLDAMRQAGELDVAPEVMASPVVQQLKQSLTQALSRIPVMESEAKAISQRIDDESERLARSMRAEAANLEAREALLGSEIEAIRTDLTRRRRDEFALERLRGEAAHARAALDDAMTRVAAQTAVADALQPDLVVVAAPEIPTAPAAPRLPLAAAGTLLAALLAGAAMNWREIRAVLQRLVSA